MVPVPDRPHYLFPDRPHYLFHLILGSFAVVTANNNVINVVPQIECGFSPKINFNIKSYPSSIDPIYELEGLKDDNENDEEVNIKRGKFYVKHEKKEFGSVVQLTKIPPLLSESVIAHLAHLIL